MFGHRALDHDGWRAVCPWPGPSFAETDRGFGTPIRPEDLTELDAHHWQLYRIEDDVAENHDLAGEHRDKLIEMIAQWYVEAGTYDVLPIDGSAVQRLMAQRPQVAEPRISYLYRPGTQTVPFFAAPRLLNRPHSITADVDLPEAGAQGVLLSQGSAVGGWSFYLLGGRLCYAHNYLRRAIWRVASTELVPPGRHELAFEFEPTAPPDIAHGLGTPGRAQLYVDHRLVGQADLPVTIPVMINPGGLTCGADPGSPVVPDYQAPFRFTGILHTVTVDLSGELITDSESELRTTMARQ
jgi:hypothetical protein